MGPRVYSVRFFVLTLDTTKVQLVVAANAKTSCRATGSRRVSLVVLVVSISWWTLRQHG